MDDIPPWDKVFIEFLQYDGKVITVSILHKHNGLIDVLRLTTHHLDMAASPISGDAVPLKLLLPVLPFRQFIKGNVRWGIKFCHLDASSWHSLLMTPCKMIMEAQVLNKHRLYSVLSVTHVHMLGLSLYNCRKAALPHSLYCNCRNI